MAPQRQNRKPQKLRASPRILKSRKARKKRPRQSWSFSTSHVPFGRSFPMAAVTTKKSVTFTHPFTLGDFDEVLQPGSYDVETDQELIEGLSFQAYRRVLTVIHLPAVSGDRTLTRALTIDPDDLDAAIQRDRDASGPLTRSEPSARNESREHDAQLSPDDLDAVEEAENEGMTRRPVPSG